MIENDLIAKISENISEENADTIINAEGKFLIPGVIDDQVHFREPGLTHKGDIESESKPQLQAGYQFIEQPNTVPNAVTQELLEKIQNCFGEILRIIIPFRWAEPMII